MKILKEAWVETKTHAPLLLTITILTLTFFWITPMIVYPFINPTVTYQNLYWTVWDYIIEGIIIGMIIVRVVIIVEIKNQKSKTK